MDGFSKGQKRIAAFILDNYDRAAFMTAARLGETASVSESTVVRFAAQLGYDGYPDMQKALQELIRGRLTSIQRIQVSRIRCPARADILGSVMQRDMNGIHDVIEQLDRVAFSRAVDKLLGAEAHLYPGCAVLLISGGVSEFLPAPDLQERDAGTGQRRRRDIRAAGHIGEGTCW